LAVLWMFQMGSRVIHKYELLIFFMGHPPIMFHLMKKNSVKI